ncbi:gag-pol polyprotein [Cucumis melo var. makuwa]|uniref:Gag-pol polyprotein n=1 Tax=Cucumis melo var. makuwa TaxID=1194695 RepID=A0A5D3CC89_CUCMM|nr:gag-pol polyprotein [Cucumis melo var. makuwa]
MILVETKPSPKGVMRREVAKPLKVKKSIVGSFRLEEVQPSGEKREAPRAIIARKVKIEKCLFPFDEATGTFLEEHGLIRRRYHNSQYDLSNDAETTGQVLITQPVKRQTKEALQTIEYLGAKVQPEKSRLKTRPRCHRRNLSTPHLLKGRPLLVCQALNPRKKPRVDTTIDPKPLKVINSPRQPNLPPPEVYKPPPTHAAVFTEVAGCKSTEIIREGPLASRLPVLDGKKYSYWKPRMILFIKTLDGRAWRALVAGWDPPMITVDGVFIPKSDVDWTNTKEQAYVGNDRALNAIFNDVDLNVFKLVNSCSYAKEA